MGLAGKTALITGGSKGIGGAAVACLASPRSATTNATILAIDGGG